LSKIKVLAVFGTRPEAIKMAPLVEELKKREQIYCQVAVTAQHRQMLDQVLSLFNIVPDYDLDIMTQGQNLFDITTRALNGLENVFEVAKPDVVLVHGDTTTTFVGALAAFYKKISVGHVEAGLRTFNKWLPFPEEMNRKLTSSLADLHFAPTLTARQNLLSEGIDPELIFVTGNTVIDALKTTVKDNYTFSTKILNEIDYDVKKVILVTAHRRENLGEPLRNICLGLRDFVKNNPEAIIVYPVHMNPKVIDVAFNILGDCDRVYLLSPIATDEMHNLMARCYFVMTDSGGLQEEAPSLGKPVLVLRKETERPEAVKAGTVKIIGTDRDKVFEEASMLFYDESQYLKMATAVNPYGDGSASRRIAESLLFFKGMVHNRPDEFDK
jgi:UDP-N-acetylglucosamine 2-epimerase (non-hydrolysing)